MAGDQERAAVLQTCAKGNRPAIKNSARAGWRVRRLMRGTASVRPSMAIAAATASTAMAFCTRGTARNSTRTPIGWGNAEDHDRDWLPHDYARDTKQETPRQRCSGLGHFRLLRGKRPCPERRRLGRFLDMEVGGVELSGLLQTIPIFDDDPAALR